VLTVRVELLPAVTDVGLREIVTPDGAPDAVSETVPAIPAATEVEMVLAPFEPGARLRLDGEALMLKSFVTAVVTVSVTVVECVLPLSVPVTVSV
jgi:hypothetical protein